MSLTKIQKRNWFYSLSELERENWIESKKKGKSLKRQRKLRLQENPKKLKCKDCIHHKTKNCTDSKPCILYNDLKDFSHD